MPLDFIPLASPDIREEDIDAVVKVLKSGNLVQGKYVESLEANIAHYLGVSNCIVVTNGTATLHLILVALGIGPNDEVIVPAFSYIATANVVELVGAKPVFVDIDIQSFNIDISKIEAKINKNTKAIIGVHEFGLAADMQSIKKICDKHGLFFIEDAACALGASEDSSFAGTIGIAGSFSFHPRKAITSGEGGAIVTNDDLLANKLRSLRNHGIDSTNKIQMDFINAGYNCRMTDFQAALLNSQLERLMSILSEKQKIARRYLNEIKSDKVILPTVPSNKQHSWQTFHVLLADSIDQSAIISLMKTKGIGTNYGAQCMPAQTYFKNKYNYNAELEFPNAYTAFRKGLAIPLYEKLNTDQVSHIINSINSL